MSANSADLLKLLQCTRQALRGASSGRGSALVERTCVTGSLARGTYVAGCEPTGLVLFLNVDLQFSPYEVPKALVALAESLRSVEALGDKGFEGFDLQIADAECRGGLWANLHARRRRPAADSGTEQAPLSDDAPFVLQLFVAENMTSTVSQRAAPISNAEALGLGPVDEHRARQQQQNLLVAAEQRLRREARYQVRQGRAAIGAATAVPAAVWAAKAACGVAEARRVFWSRQPEAALRAARAAHETWRLTLDATAKQLQKQPQSHPEQQQKLWSDEVVLLLDVLALHAYRQEAEAGAEGAIVTRIFTILSAGSVSCEASKGALRVALQGGVLAGDGEGVAAGLVADAPAGGAEAESLVVLDPCFPVLDVYAAACEAVGQGEGADVGKGRLRDLAAAAVGLASAARGGATTAAVAAVRTVDAAAAKGNVAAPAGVTAAAAPTVTGPMPVAAATAVPTADAAAAADATAAAPLAAAPAADPKMDAAAAAAPAAGPTADAAAAADATAAAPLAAAPAAGPTADAAAAVSTADAAAAARPIADAITAAGTAVMEATASGGNAVISPAGDTVTADKANINITEAAATATGDDTLTGCLAAPAAVDDNVPAGSAPAKTET
ncbi:hypothetical protein Vretimale_19228 [Volvox reticuliferus]|uniref:Uncharacterized protein n=1 Tax=Volvox reticuliferus TaxID=1737510 RepID=A0A8J4FZV8_9CHLO|nr:hypothetical protein Vretifemale_20292 [Volvox reticuliferus]GIM16599.1 hypothetical protein Vretimale_19228 [Volvox reticuliferus]